MIVMSGDLSHCIQFFYYILGGVPVYFRLALPFTPFDSFRLYIYVLYVVLWSEIVYLVIA